MLIGMIDLKRLRAGIDLGGLYADFQIDGTEVRIGLKPETDAFNVEEEKTENEDSSRNRACPTNHRRSQRRVMEASRPHS